MFIEGIHSYQLGSGLELRNGGTEKIVDTLESKRWILVSGKGGTGKTVLTSSLAVQLAKTGEKTLVVSIDPAHSLADALKMEVGAEMTPVEDVENLTALEFTPEEMYQLDEEELKGALEERKEEIEEMNFLSLSPGEMMNMMSDMSSLPLEFAEGLNFIKLFSSLKESEYDRILFDTAPTGHLLKLLEMPDKLDSFLGKIIKFRLKLASFWDRFKGLFGMGEGNPQEMMLKSLETMKNQVEDLRKVLQDEEKTEFISVTIPTEMAILESQRLIGTIEGYEIPHHYLVVNQIRIYNEEDCQFCRGLSKVHYQNLQDINQKFSDLAVRCVPYFSEEVRGLPKLERFYKFVEGTTPEVVDTWLKEGKSIK